MTTYTGMTLGGEIRESVSLDEDDLSDVEDEVFIRDGKHGSKFAEDVGVKRPLMAPRRKLGRPTITTRLKTRPPCKAFCKPCCYVFVASSVLLGLIALVVIVSIFPLPLDRFKNWVVKKITVDEKVRNYKLLPCSDLKVTDVWKVNLPKLTTESPIRTLDVNGDGIEDVIFGFATENEGHVLRPDVFCPIFMGFKSPCDGGVLALNGSNGNVLWRFWTNDTIFNLVCSADVDADGVLDCLITGKKGTIGIINAKTGVRIWLNSSTEMDVYTGNFVGDQNNDTIPDVLAACTSFEGSGHLILISGRTGETLKQIKVPATFFTPQLIGDKKSLILFGTGGPSVPGNLSVLELNDFLRENVTNLKTVYAGLRSGMLNQATLVDVNGDNVSDLIVPMFNSTVIAFDGVTFKPLWNFTVANSETLIAAAPAYFNEDNVTDFLVIYKDINSIFSKTFILNGKDGKKIYENYISDSITTQLGTLSLLMEGEGLDMFLFWTYECFEGNFAKMKDENVDERVGRDLRDVCTSLVNSTYVVKLNALNQFSQPPGFEIYNSIIREQIEFNNTKSPVEEVIDFLEHNPGDFESTKTSIKYDEQPKINREKGYSNFRRKDISSLKNKFDQLKLDPDYDSTGSNPDPSDIDYTYLDEPNPFGIKDNYYATSKNTRDPRSRQRNASQPTDTIYNYRNIRNARKRLLHDLGNSPTEILRETYFKNRESQLRKSRFEQRDISSHRDKLREKEELRKVLEREKLATANASENLWTLESEKEVEEREGGYVRTKRGLRSAEYGLQKVTSVGALTSAFNSSKNAIDLVFVTYWLPTRTNVRSFSAHLEKCIKSKIGQSFTKLGVEEQANSYMRECENELKRYQKDFPFFDDVFQLKLGQMTVYRLRVECICKTSHGDERCAKILSGEEQKWGSYLGKKGDGSFRTGR